MENITAGDDLAKVKQSLPTQSGVATKLIKRMEDLLQQAHDATDNWTAVHQKLRGCYVVDKIALLSRLDQQRLSFLTDDERSEEQDSCLHLMEELQDKRVQYPTVWSNFLQCLLLS